MVIRTKEKKSRAEKGGKGSGGGEGRKFRILAELKWTFK